MNDQPHAHALDTDQAILLYREALAGKPPSITTPYALQYYERVKAEIAEMRQRGVDHFHIPS